MPELPEVETIARTLAPLVQGRSLISIEILNAGTWQGLLRPESFCPMPLAGVSRRGKLLLLLFGKRKEILSPCGVLPEWQSFVPEEDSGDNSGVPSEEYCWAQSKAHSGEQSEVPSEWQSKEDSTEQSKEHSGEQSTKYFDEQSREQPEEHFGEQSEESSEGYCWAQSKAHSGEYSEVPSEWQSKEDSTEQSKKHSGEQSTKYFDKQPEEYSERQSGAQPEEHFGEQSEESSEGQSKEYFAGQSVEQCREYSGKQSSVWGLAFHLKMSGRLFAYGEDEQPTKHTRLILHLDDGSQIFFDDARKFGYARALIPEECRNWSFWQELGPDPFELSAEDFAARLKKNTAIKAALLDQKTVAGIGNIYADESLFKAGIAPGRKGASLEREQLCALHGHVREILKESIEQCGSSIKDYRTARGDAGSFQNFFRVYGRSGEKCYLCGNALETKKIAGRTTVFCPHCQK